MLVRTTKIGDPAFIGGPHRVRILSVRGQRVQWGIEAAPDGPLATDAITVAPGATEKLLTFREPKV